MAQSISPLTQQLHQAYREVFLQQQRHLRGAADLHRHQLGQQVRPNGVDDADAQGAGQRVVALPRDLFDAGAFFQHFLRLRDDALADGGDAHLGAATLKQRHAQFVFQLAYRDGQRRLADETGLGRPAEMPFARNRDDVLEFGESHGGLRPRGVRAGLATGA